MKEDVSLYIEQCSRCAKLSSHHIKPKAHTGSDHVGAPMEKIADDLMGPYMRQVDITHIYLWFRI